MDYAQSLYEKKLITYPRTDSRFLTEDMAVNLPKLSNSVVEKFGYTKGFAPNCKQAKICEDIDAVLSWATENFEEFLRMMQEQKYEIKRGKHTAIKGKDQKRFVRFKSLGEGYTQDDLEERIRGEGESE